MTLRESLAETPRSSINGNEMPFEMPLTISVSAGSQQHGDAARATDVVLRGRVMEALTAPRQKWMDRISRNAGCFCRLQCDAPLDPGISRRAR